MRRPLLHGSGGEDRALPDMFDISEISFLDCSVAASRLAYDRPVANSLVSGTEIEVPKFVVVPQSIFFELGAPAVMKAGGVGLGSPLVVKPKRGGSALGVTVVRKKTE